MNIDDGLATIDLSREFEAGGGSLSMFGRLAQLVYTVTQFPTVDEVALMLDGQRVDGFWSSRGNWIILAEDRFAAPVGAVRGSRTAVSVSCTRCVEMISVGGVSATLWLALAPPRSMRSRCLPECHRDQRQEFCAAQASHPLPRRDELGTGGGACLAVKGLRPARIFFRYALRNAILPQTTALALTLGHVVSGAILVEVVFSYPGVGTLLFQSVRTFDYPVIYGITFMIIVSIGLVTLILDFLLPFLDPRIKYQR
jgi:hypothetical protein